MADEPKLTPEEIELFVAALEKVERRRKVMIGGYLLAVLAMIGGELGALIAFGLAPKGARIGWVFFIPFGLTGLILWLFGKWAKRIR